MGNPDEIVDVVDENDGVLYPTKKKEAHEKGLLHRTVISEIKDSQGRWVLTKQASDRQDPGQYVSPVGGHVTSGETEDEALMRESHEECGIKDFEYKLVGKKIFNRTVLGRQENHYFVLYEIFSDAPIVLNEESSSYRTFTDAELKNALRGMPEIFGAAFHFIVKTFYPELLA